MAHVRSFAPAQPCAFCGKDYRPRSDLLKQGRGRFCSRKCCNDSRQPPMPAVEEIERLYLVEKMPIQQIAGRVGIGWRRVRAALVDAGVELRPGGWRPTASYRTVYGPSGERTREHQAVAQEHGLVRPGEVVHHINCNKQDNRPSNLAGLTRSEHAMAHWELQRIAGLLVDAGLIEWRGRSYICSSRLERLLRDA